MNWGGITVKPCDSCKSAAAILFCRPDSTFLCMACDSKIHGANKLASRHERVWMCEVCEQAPAAVTCKADAAALCVTCDADIHSANPLARRHDRVPVEPFYYTADAESLIKSSSNDEAEAASWILPNPNLVDKFSDPFLSDFDHLLEYDYITSMDHHTHGSDSVVPVQQIIKNHPTDTCFEIDFCKSKLTPYNYTAAQSNSHSISSSSMDVGVVPEGNRIMSSETSFPFGKQINNASVDQLLGMGREARVLRYREKRKNRKFEKTIRYASRKAYAETRPRIKGRFAKRTDNDETHLDRMFNSVVGSEDFLAVVPSF